MNDTLMTFIRILSACAYGSTVDRLAHARQITNVVVAARAKNQ